MRLEDDMELFDTLVRFETRLWNRIETELARNGQVGLATLQALGVLDRHRGAGRVHDLSAELSITIGAASKLVDRLERDGLATRRPHPDDRRSSLVSLTDAGTRALRDGQGVASALASRVFSDENDVTQLASTLERLQTTLDQLEGTTA
jgi:MarR family multiple antibiotic resistance transcriptional regulator